MREAILAFGRYLINFKISGPEIGFLGLIINSVGALLLSVSIMGASGLTTGHTEGSEYKIAIVNDWGTEVGLKLIILGFIFQILEKCFGKNAFSFWLFLIFTVSSYYLLLRLSFFIPRLLFK